jgi:hypothetical protein
MCWNVGVGFLQEPIGHWHDMSEEYKQQQMLATAGIACHAMNGSAG